MPKLWSAQIKILLKLLKNFPLQQRIIDVIIIVESIMVFTVGEYKIMNIAALLPLSSSRRYRSK